MTLPVPHPDDPREALYEKAVALRAACEERDAVVARIKAYLAPWARDKRMKVMGEILLKEIGRIEQEEARRTRDGARGPPPPAKGG